MERKEKILIGILVIFTVFFIIFANNVKKSDNIKVEHITNNSIEENKIDETSKKDEDLKEVKVSGYHLTTYNQSAKNNSLIKLLEVKASNAAKVRFVIGSIDDKSIVNERVSFEVECKKGENVFNLTEKRYIIKKSEYLFMDISGQDTLYIQENTEIKTLVQNESNKVAGQMPVEKSDFMLPFKYTLEKVNDYNALIIGNDITDIDNENSYYNLTKGMFEKTFKTLDINRINAKEWELNKGLKSRKDWIEENLKEDYVAEQDLVIFQLGDNYKDVSSLESDVTDLVEYIRKYSPNAEMLWVGIWDYDRQILNKLPGVCEKLGIKFVNISDLSTINYQVYTGEKEAEDTEANFVDQNSMTSFAQRFYPNNQAMQIISNRIIEALGFEF